MLAEFAAAAPSRCHAATAVRCGDAELPADVTTVTARVAERWSVEVAMLTSSGAMRSGHVIDCAGQEAIGPAGHRGLVGPVVSGRRR
jgi:hypothetical protein